jgi:hypothetical protein
MKFRALVVGLVTVAAAHPGAGERLVVRVTPAVAFAPANLNVRATVEANQENRAIEVIAESDLFYRSSEISLDGDRAPRTTVIQFRSLPGGAYHVRTILKGPSGRELASTQSNVNVVDSGSLSR